MLRRMLWATFALGALCVVPKIGLQKIGLPPFDTIAQAQTASKFAVGQQIVVKLEDGYYLATVDQIYPKDGYTALDFSWNHNGASGSGTYPADDADFFTIAEARRQKFVIVNQAGSSPPIEQAAPAAPTPSPIAQVAPAKPVATNSGSSSVCSGPNQLTSTEIQEILKVHNAARAEVGVPPLKWNCKLADFAQSWANKDVWEHSSDEDRQQIIPGSYAGENLAASAPANAAIATKGPTNWWKEKAFWNNATGSCQSGKVCGHYTQMVWRNTTEIGCGLNRKASVLGSDWAQNSAYLVCVYNPGGNYGGEKPF